MLVSLSVLSGTIWTSTTSRSRSPIPILDLFSQPPPSMGRRLREPISPCMINAQMKKLKHRGLMLLLFETPTGFAIFRFNEVYFHLPYARETMWARFSEPGEQATVVILKEFQTFKDKASAINDSGVNKELADMINRWLLPDMKMAVGKPGYKTIIESELKITCIHNEIAMEVMWGIQHLMYWFVPHETVEVAKEDRLPMSQGLQMLLSSYGFDVKPEMVNDQIVKTAGALFKCDVVDDDCSPELREYSLSLKKISGINCEDWSLLKLATALKVIFRPEEEKGDNYRKVLSEDELLKLKDEAPKLKYLNTLSQYVSLAAYDRLWSAYRVRTQKKKLLESLIKKAKEAYEAQQAQAYEAEQAQACEKGKVHGESEQIPQEHVNELPLLKGLKRSRDSAFEPIVLSKSTFVEGLSIGETGGKRIARISGAQPTYKEMVPYKPFPHAVLLNSCAENQSHNIDVDNMDGHNINLGISTLPPPLTESVEQASTHLGSVGDSKDEAEQILAEHSDQTEVSAIENVQQSARKKVHFQADGLSGLVCRLQKDR